MLFPTYPDLVRSFCLFLQQICFQPCSTPTWHTGSLDRHAGALESLRGKLSDQMGNGRTELRELMDGYRSDLEFSLAEHKAGGWSA